MDSAKKIHVLHVVPGLGPGGMELALARVVKGLTNEAMRHSIICLKGQAEIADCLPGETEIHCLYSRPNEPQLPFRLSRIIRQIRPTVIHARNWGAWPDIAAARIFTWPIVPFILSFHGLGEANYMPLRRRLASGILARLATYLFTVSEESKQLLISKWGWPKDKVQVIPNGVDTRLFQPLELPRDTTRIVIGSVGNLRPVKNHALLLAACSELARRGFDLELRIAGQGPQRNSLLALAQSLGFSQRLKLPGFIEQVPDFLRHLDIFVLSSDSEQHNNALNEAMACGVPSIATSVGSAPEVLDNGRYGLLVQPGNEKDLTDAILAMIKNPELQNQFSLEGRKRICQNYSLEHMLAAYEEMYRRLSSGKGNDR